MTGRRIKGLAVNAQSLLSLLAAMASPSRHVRVEGVPADARAVGLIAAPFNATRDEHMVMVVTQVQVGPDVPSDLGTPPRGIHLRT